jgi:hypothetical protein
MKVLKEMVGNIEQNLNFLIKEIYSFQEVIISALVSFCDL